MQKRKDLLNPPFVCAILYKATHIFLLLPASSLRGKEITGADLWHCSWKVHTFVVIMTRLKSFFWERERERERSSGCVNKTLYTQHTSRRDAMITIRLYLATRSKHVAKYNLILIFASCLEVCSVLTVHNILHKTDEFFIN